MTYGCHNKLRSDGYWARNGSIAVQDDIGFGPETVVEAQLLVWISDTMSRECRYDGRATDAWCKGCQRK